MEGEMEGRIVGKIGCRSSSVKKEKVTKQEGSDQ